MYKHTSIFFSLLTVLLLALITTGTLTGCRSDNSTRVQTTDSLAPLPDTLRVVTLYSPQSYFLYRGEPMGFDYEMARDLADDEGWTMELTVADSLPQAVAMLDSGKVDLIAYNVPLTGEYKSKVLPAGLETVTTQVLIQNGSAPDKVKSVGELRGRKVAATEGSMHMLRLQELDKQLGGAIDIDPLGTDLADDETVMAAVSEGKIPMAIIDSDIAGLNTSAFPNVDTSVELGSPRRAAWAVAPGNTRLADAINNWAKRSRRLQQEAILLDRYFARSQFDPTNDPELNARKQLSPYDDLFKKYAAEIGWDWRLLAAQAHTESKFKPKAVSWAGARGLMQIMPSTARGYGVTPKQLDDPETSIRTAVKYLGQIDRWLKSRIPDDRERQKFILAAYNAGVAHVYDAVALARKYKMNPLKWNGNVEKAILMKTKRRYYKDPVVKYGYSRGHETYNYVRRIYDYYDKAVERVPA